MLRELLQMSGHDEWADPAELACTELVTNAVLHAHTHITVTVELRPDELRVAVSDGSRDLPRQRAGDAQATTGRGMLLVARLVTEHGARREDAGKTVWFTLRTSPGPPGGDPSPDDLLSLWADDTPGTSGSVGPGSGSAGDPSGAEAARDAAGSTRVLLVGLPPTLWLAAAEHHQTVLRELVLYLAEHRDVAVDMAPVDAARTLLDDAVAGAVEQARREGTARRPLPEDHPGTCRGYRTWRRSPWRCPPATSPPSRPCRTRWTWPSGWPPTGSCWPDRGCPRSWR
jgi:anti-sigma regulatory factor (Ser/Thr protein kinase)